MTTDLHVDYEAQPLPAAIQEQLTAHASCHHLPYRQWFTPYTARVLAGRRLLPHAVPAEVASGTARLQLYNRAQTIDRSVAHAAGVFARLCIEARASGLPGSLQLYAGALVLHQVMVRSGCAVAASGEQAEPDRILPTAIPLTVMLFELLDIDEIYAGLREAVVWLFLEVRDGLQGDASLGWLWSVAGGFLSALRAGEYTGALPDLLARFGTAAQRAQLLQSALTDNLPLLQSQCEAGLREWSAASAEAPGADGRSSGSGGTAETEAGALTHDVLQLLGGEAASAGSMAPEAGAEAPCGVPVCYCAPRTPALDLGIKCELRDERGDSYFMSYGLAEADALLTEHNADGTPNPGYAACLEGEHAGRGCCLVISGPHIVLAQRGRYEAGEGDEYRERLLGSCAATLSSDKQGRAGRFRRPVHIRLLKRIQLADGGQRLTGVQAARWMLERSRQQDLSRAPSVPGAGSVPASGDGAEAADGLQYTD